MPGITFCTARNKCYRQFSIGKTFLSAVVKLFFNTTRYEIMSAPAQGSKAQQIIRKRVT